MAVVGPALAFQVTLFSMPGLYTTDMFSYVMYGHIAGVVGVNPYTQHAVVVPRVSGSSTGSIRSGTNAPSIYGPAWIDLTLSAGAAVARSTDVDKVLAYKALVNVGHLASVGVLAVRVHKLRPGTGARERWCCTPGTRSFCSSSAATATTTP